MSSSQPKKVYRYQRLSATTIESLCSDKLFFARPTAFNDPHDCKPTVESDSDGNTLRTVLAKLITRRVEAETIGALKDAKVQGKKAEAHAHRSGKQAAHQELANIKYNATNPDYEVSKEEAERWLLTSAIQQELLAQYDRRLCCFSETVDNPLLWSHYADKHQGICIGYGLNRVPRPNLHKVVYGGSRTVKTSLIARALLENDMGSKNLLDREVLLRKAPSWRYEREWRLLGEVGAQDSCLELIDVTFGLRCPAALQHALISALASRSNTVKFFEMHEIDGSFKLKRSLVDTEELRGYFPKTAMSGEEIFGPAIPDE